MKYKRLAKKIKHPFLARLILSTEFTFMISILIMSAQIIVLGVTLLFCLIEHFQRISETKCIFNLTDFKLSLGLCFFVRLIPGLLIVPFLAGFLLWPIVLTMHTFSMMFKNKKYIPPFYWDIQNIQQVIGLWLLNREKSLKENEFMRGIIHMGMRDDIKALPVEIMQLILEKVQSNQQQEISWLVKHMRKTSRPQYNSNMLNLHRIASFFHSDSGYIILSSNALFSPTDILHERMSYYAVFSKDAFYFGILILLQISLPYWLYNL